MVEELFDDLETNPAVDQPGRERVAPLVCGDRDGTPGLVGDVGGGNERPQLLLVAGGVER